MDKEKDKGKSSMAWKRELETALAGKDTAGRCAARLGVRCDTFNRRLAKARVHGVEAVLPSLPGKNRVFSGDFKLEVVNCVLSEKLAWRVASTKYNLEPRVIKNWVAKYLKCGFTGLFAKDEIQMARKKIPEIDDLDAALLASLKIKNAHLEQEKRIAKAAEILSDGKAVSVLLRKEKYDLIDKLRGEFTVKDLLSFFGVAKSTFYGWLIRKGRALSEKEQLIRKTMMEIHDEYTRAGHRCGSVPMTEELNLRIAETIGGKVNRKKVCRLMHELGIVGEQKREGKHNSYKGEQGLSAENIVNRNFDVKTADTVWGTDVTEFKTASGQKNYLSIVRDFCTGEIVGYSCSTSPSLNLVMESIEKALSSRDIKPEQLTIQSDRGFQYRTATYVKKLEEYGVIRSMSRKGNCLDNAKTETFFARIKNDMYYGHEYKTIEQLNAAINAHIEFYNKLMRRRFEKRNIA